jgi:hypothetical protein
VKEVGSSPHAVNREGMPIKTSVFGESPVTISGPPVEIDIHKYDYNKESKVKNIHARKYWRWTCKRLQELMLL